MEGKKISMNKKIPGIGEVTNDSGLIYLEQGEAFTVGKDGVKAILTPADRKAEFIVFEDKTLCYVKSSMGYPAIYPIRDTEFEAPVKAVLMDLDGTSVHSESFWMWIIEQTVGRLMGNPKFQLESIDEPHVSGHSVSEHLQYCIHKYCSEKTVEEARKYYYEITEYEMKEIMEGRGKAGAFTPAPGLKEFLMTLKKHKVKIGLVTSGLYTKSMPEIISAFRTLDMGDPLAFYDTIINAGTALKKGQAGTLGELEIKPHPWLYAETARVGLGLQPYDSRVIGFEDSAAGVLSVRLAGFPVIGIGGGNIQKSGTGSLCLRQFDHLCDSLPFILGE